MTTYTLAGGCFWCIDAVFQKLRGVHASVSGYAGGDERDADYYMVASGKTNHAETVQVTFDETIIPAETLLDIFFLIHDPTSHNQQGNDKGQQYRSAMFYTDEIQQEAFYEAKQRAQKHWDEPIVTEIIKLPAFFGAEPEHQDYFANNPFSPYCFAVINPKVSKAKKAYAQYFKEAA